MSVIGTPVTSSGAEGRYVTQSRMETVRGINNIAIWSRKSGTGDEVDTDAVQAAIDTAESKIDAELSVRYGMPLTSLTGAAAVAMESLAEPMASYELYYQRGEANTSDGPGGDLKVANDEAIARLNKYRIGALSLPGVSVVGGTHPLISVQNSDKPGQVIRSYPITVL